MNCCQKTPMDAALELRWEIYSEFGAEVGTMRKKLTFGQILEKEFLSSVEIVLALDVQRSGGTMILCNFNPRTAIEKIRNSLYSSYLTCVAYLVSCFQPSGALILSLKLRLFRGVYSENPSLHQTLWIPWIGMVPIKAFYLVRVGEVWDNLNALKLWF